MKKKIIISAVTMSLIIIIVATVMSITADKRYHKAFSEEFQKSIVGIEYYPNDNGYYLTDRESIDVVMKLFLDERAIYSGKNFGVDGGLCITVYTDTTQYKLYCYGKIVTAPDGRWYKIGKDITDLVADTIITNGIKNN